MKLLPFNGCGLRPPPGESCSSEHTAMPETANPSPPPSHSRFRGICPGHIFDSLGYHVEKKDPIFKAAKEFTHDFDESICTVEGLTEFDADERVLVLMAHDHPFLPIFTGEEDNDGAWFFPHRTLNDWPQADLRERGRQRFRNDVKAAIEKE
ncbi:hypothetical protein PENANT_c019G05249 [Penicillium antarcticum]|uniref:Uncharacterized protein n=1 Tax=Penicillium antarcticum TaxID=416450 RepID=A0A1V6Q0Z4_9EURO|nr:hypothetical protein PENANT_c019G05249 [Penicillium antarcticum]